MGPATAAHYEALRPLAPAAGRPPPGVGLLQRCGLVLWAHTCTAVSEQLLPSRPRPTSVSASSPPTPTGVVLDALPTGAREQLARVLASMLLHQQPGGSDESLGADPGLRRPGPA